MSPDFTNAINTIITGHKYSEQTEATPRTERRGFNIKFMSNQIYHDRVFMVVTVCDVLLLFQLKDEKKQTKQLTTSHI